MKLKFLPVNKIRPNPMQPREIFDTEKLKELSESIKSTDLLAPIIVRANNGGYQIVAGERRWRASKSLGMKKIPAIIKNVDNKRILIESLIENLHREDLTDFEKAKAIRNLMKQDKLSPREIAKRLGKTESYVRQYLSILPLEKEIDSATSEKVGVKVLRAVSTVPQKAVRQKLIKKVTNGEMSSLYVEKIVPIIKKAPETLKDAILDHRMDPDIAKELMKIDDKRIHEKVVKELKQKNKYEERILKTAKFAVERSKAMEAKFFRLKELLQEGLNLSTVWDIGPRKNYAGDLSFHGNSPTQVVEQCILRLTKENDLVVDPMSGSGTTIDVCKELNRNCIAYDIKPTRDDIIKNDARKIPLDNESVDFVFLHFPYWNTVKYSNERDDLSRMSLDTFLENTNKIIKESKRILKKNKYLCILIGDLVEKGEFIPLTRKIANIAESMGLTDCGYAIKLTSGSTSQIVRGKALYAELAYTGNLKINHDTVMFWKK